MSNNHKTAIKAFLATEWAVEEAWARRALAVLHGEKFDYSRESPTLDALLLGSAVAGDSEGREFREYGGSRLAVASGNTVVVDIYGAIIPRADLLSEWSGGVACSRIRAVLSEIATDPEIDHAIFVFDSPGGAVSGVAETANAIRELGVFGVSTTAYVSGMAASAAYWLASACDRIIATPTAILGSIGVMAVYQDDTKRKEMAGIEELEFISSQSPLKNADPKTDAGRTAIQSRIDALADVFISTVAAYRGKDKDYVAANFGRGGVFVGEQAVTAGLADEIGLFADAMSAPENNSNNNQENFMADKNSTANAVDSAEFEAMKSQLAELQSANATQAAALEALQAEKARLEQEKQTAQIASTVAGFPGEVAHQTTILTALVSAHGFDSEIVKAHIATQTALKAQLDAASTFDEFGSTQATGDERTAADKLEALAKAIQARDNVDYHAAYAKALTENPSLYSDYNAGK